MITFVTPHEGGQSHQTQADRWYAALDNQRVQLAGRDWVVQVDGIHSVGPDLWIQLSRVGFSGRGIVLHVTSGVTIDEALSALAARREEIHQGDVVRVGIRPRV